ncbi:MAG: hypothetical protein ABSE57_21150 [Bryobacteraceae bacterium]
MAHHATDRAQRVAQRLKRKIDDHRLLTLIENLGLETHHFAFCRAHHHVPHPALFVRAVSPANRFPERGAEHILQPEPGAFDGGDVAFDEFAVQREKADKPEQRVDDIAQPLLAGGQFGRRLQTLRHVSNGADNANGRALIVTNDAAARNHPTIGAITVHQAEFVLEPVFGGVLIVTVPGLRHSRAVFGMDAPKERRRSVGQLVVAIAQNLLVTRGKIVSAGYDVPIENTFVDGLGHQGVAFLALTPRGLGQDARGNVAAIPQNVGAISALVQYRIDGNLERVAQIRLRQFATQGGIFSHRLLVEQTPGFDLVRRQPGCGQQLAKVPAEEIRNVFPHSGRKVFRECAIDSLRNEDIAWFHPEQRLQVRSGVENYLLPRFALPQGRFG